jgi:hypothetical protein
MQWRKRTLLRLSGKEPPTALERKSGQHMQAAILRRFFVVLEKLESRIRAFGDEAGRDRR